MLEHADDIKVVTGDFAWDDLGSWDALYDHLPATENGLIQEGDTLAINCEDSLLISRTGQILTGIGLKGMSVVATEDAILVVPKGSSQEVKQIVQALQDKGRDDLL